MQMRALYYISLPTERQQDEDKRNYESDIKANENCLNQNFTTIASKLNELEEKLALLTSSNGQS